MLELTLSIFFHAGLGIVLAALVWALGAGALAGARHLGSPFEPASVFAYPAGLLVALVACFAYLLSPWLGLLTGAGLLVALVLSAPAVAPVARRAAEPVAWALPAVLGLPVVLGFFLHGPTKRVDSNAFGDVVWYVAKLASAKQSLFPFRDLAASGVHLWRAESAPSLVGAVVTELPGTDPFLFHTTLLPAFALASLCVGFSLQPPRPRLSGPQRVVLALLAAAAVAYPTWLAESPPVTLALPLAFPIYVLACEELPLPAFVAGAVLVVVDLALTKGLVLAPLAILLAFAVRGRYRLGGRRVRLLTAAAALVAVGVVVLALQGSFWILHVVRTRFTPLTAYRGLRSQLDTRSTIELAPALELAGWLLLAAALLRARSRSLLAALLVCLVWSWTISGYSIAVGLGTIALLAALRFRDVPADTRLLAPAAVCLATATWFRDFAGISAALVEVACLVAVVLSALTTIEGRPWRELASFHAALYALVGAMALLALSGHPYPGWALAAAAALLLSLRLPRPAAAAGLAAVALVVGLRADTLRLGTYDTTILPAEQYGVWHQVAKVVPPDGLVFTSMTGPEIEARTGLNYYPPIGGRQVYLAGWYQSRLRTEPDELARRLRENFAVLDGKRSPREIETYGSFGSYYAVLPRTARPPPTFRRVYANRLYAIYRIAP